MKPLILGVMLALSATSLSAEVSNCMTRYLDNGYRLQSVSETKFYGLLVTAPQAGCQRVSYAVLTSQGRPVGHTRPLAPGERAIIRVGRGFSAGEHRLIITARGCALQPGETRRVTLFKNSPDHGWRASD